MGPRAACRNNSARCDRRGAPRTEMAKPLEQRDATKMLKFEEQDHALNELSQQLDDLIHGAWNMEDATRPSPVSISNTSRRETLLRIRRLIFS